VAPTALPSAQLPGYADVRLAVPLLGRVARTIDSFCPTLVHCTTEFVIGWMGQRIAGARGLPVVSSYHTDFTRYAHAYRMSWLAKPVTRFIGRFHRRSAHTYTPSAPARADLAAMGVSDVEVWGRAVDVSAFHPSKRSEPLRDTDGGRESFSCCTSGASPLKKASIAFSTPSRWRSGCFLPARYSSSSQGQGPRKNGCDGMWPTPRVPPRRP